MFDQKNKRARLSRQEWQSLVDAFAASSLDVKTFCDAQSIKPDRLRFWCRRLKKSKFIELPEIVNQPMADRETWDLELTLGQNVTLRLRGH